MSAAAQIQACKWPRLTFLENASLVGGSDSSLGVDVMPFPALLAQADILASDIEEASFIL